MTKIVVDTTDLFDVNEAAQQLGIAYATIFRWIKKGIIAPVRLNRRTYIPKYEIERIRQSAEINQ